VIFGGNLQPSQVATNTVWTQSGLVPSGVPPFARGGHVAVFDPTRRVMVVHGGTSAGLVVDEVWELDLGSGDWTEPATIGGAPFKRTYHSAIYDPARDRLIGFGGMDTFGGLRNDAWTMSLVTREFQPLATAGTPPPARYAHAAIYDPIEDRMIVYGGIAGPFSLNDVWSLSLASPPTWSQLSPAGAPPPASTGGALYDPVRTRMVVTVEGATEVDVYALPLSSPLEWTLLGPAGNPPPTRISGTVVYDPTRDRMILFGGSSDHRVWSLFWSPFELDASVPPAAVRLGAARPNPATAAVTFDLQLSAARLVRMSVYNVQGRLVRDATPGSLPIGRHSLVWDGTDSRGHRVPPGIYFMRVDAGGDRWVRRATLTR